MSHAPASRADEIEAWFLAHDDGEFCVIPPDRPSARIGDPRNAGTIVYTTKPHCLSRIRNLCRLQQPIATVGRYGLPRGNDLPFIRGASLYRIFLGDADPPDILAFAWLCEHLPIQWYGVNDDFLAQHGTRNFDPIRIPLSGAERETVPVLPRLCPNFHELLGEYCSSLLDSGFKIELEGAIVDLSTADGA